MVRILGATRLGHFRARLPTAYYLRPTTYYLLPTAYYPPPATYYQLPTTVWVQLLVPILGTEMVLILGTQSGPGN